jgi:hypothetical protein
MGGRRARRVATNHFIDQYREYYGRVTFRSVHAGQGQGVSSQPPDRPGAGEKINKED